MIPAEPDERSAQAGEYVLGTLDAAERVEIERALPQDAALRAEVYRWQDRLLGLVRRVAAVEPRAGGWAAIEARLGEPATSAPATPAANDPLWQRLRRWQLAGGAALAASIVLGALLVGRVGAPPAPDRYLAVLQAPGGARDTGWIVEVTAGRTVKLLPVATTAAAPAGRTLQFWTKPQGAAGPTSLGLVRANEAVELPVERLPAVEAQQLFELTLEPEGGSTIGRPTGPILYVGSTVKL
ncbi:MAG TPA: anti-sigma factor [Methylibium sp.]|uniref:anti-sigma factor n=1 Tax=Methylibium sp. TaxID=2067992 RepID=UPI002DBBD5FA|nr:anti-sigma factor [Methylibium sp.]HEU4460379.1 anti-sigma factor [Methylibium sp.]